jgi:hypothetical protein
MEDLLRTIVMSLAGASTAFLAALALIIAAGALWSGGRRDLPADPDETASRFSKPVSLIVPLGPDAVRGVDTVRSLLGLSYPEFEVIVVCDSRGETAPQALLAEWRLEAKEYFYRRSLATARVARTYRSGVEPRLLVVAKEQGGHADAINCGVNLARFQYVAAVGTDIRFDKDALARAMLPVVRDPANLVAISHHVERRPVGEFSTLEAFEWFVSMRTLLYGRLSSRWGAGWLKPADALVVWRREAVVAAGGFSSETADPDFDMMVRLQERSSDAPALHAAAGAQPFGWTPAGGLRLASASARRRQLAILQAAMRNRSCAAGLELLAPFVQALWLLLMTASALIGWITPLDLLAVGVLLSFGSAILTTGALIARGSASDAPNLAVLTRLLLLTPLDVLLFRPALVRGRAAGVWTWLRTFRSVRSIPSA